MNGTPVASPAYQSRRRFAHEPGRFVDNRGVQPDHISQGIFGYSAMTGSCRQNGAAPEPKLTNISNT
jgi:hypothetical protein